MGWNRIVFSPMSLSMQAHGSRVRMPRRGRIGHVMTATLEDAIITWYAASARDLPWRRPGAGAWPILVSEVMLQQTPVTRVLPAYEAWLARWPTAAALASARPADAVRQWDRLGYPRRAVRLHAAARMIVQRHGGEVPDSVADLRTLPGVGAYTAAAVASFAFGQRHAVLDTNVRRVLARLARGTDLARGSALSTAETAMAESLLPPAAQSRAAAWSVAVMELGALICTAARPACGRCPVAADCAWLQAGCPPASSTRQAPRYEGSDRQARGALLAALRRAPGPVPVSDMDLCWPDAGQRARVLAALITDGLVERGPGMMIGLVGDSPAEPRR
jgi:A/G-specific adenine glycosylase